MYPLHNRPGVYQTMIAILMDAETTGLLRPSERPLSEQPFITEIYLLKKQGKKSSRYHSMVKPPIPIPEECIEITGITDDMVKDAPSFAEIYYYISKFFLGTHRLVAHNVTFDSGVLEYELKRIDRVTKFPWPPEHYCTVEESFHIKGRRLKLSELHIIATDVDFKGAHRAKEDVEALERCYNYLQEINSDVA